MREEKKNTKAAKALAAGCAAAALFAFAAYSASQGADPKKAMASKTSEASVVTNDNGSVTRLFTECNIKTNGSMVTEHRRETRTTLDTAGNVLESSTSEYSQSYTVGDEGAKPLASAAKANEPAKAAESFLGIKFCDEFSAKEFESVAEEPSLLRVKFEPKKPLAGFDEYYVYVTPKTHKAAKVCACAKKAVEPGARWRRHYLVEALEKRYGTWARLCSFTRPAYAFDIGAGRYATVCLAGASRDYETILAAWDDSMLALAARETEERLAEARKAANEKRAERVDAAADAF